MNRNKKIVTATMAAGMAAVLSAGTIAAAGQSAETSGITKEETVYVNAGADGAVKDVIVSDWLKNSGGASSVSDISDLKDIKNVKGDEAFQQNGENLIWDTEDADIYYQGTTTKELPVAVEIKYYLSGNEIMPDELAGKSGHLKMVVTYKNKQKAVKKIDGKSTDVYAPFAIVTGMFLSTDKFKNVTIDNGKVVSDGDRNIVVGIGLPGLSDSLDLDEKIKKEIEIPEGFTLEADVTDCEMETTFTVALTDLLDEINVDDIDNIDELKDSLKDLSDASLELVKGTKTLYDGTSELNTKYKKFADGISQLQIGAREFQSGSKELQRGANALKTGVSSYTEGADTLAAGVMEYTGGVGTISDKLKEYTNGVSTLTGGIKAYVEGSGTLTDGVIKYTDGAANLADGITQFSQQAKPLEEGLRAFTDGGEDEKSQMLKEIEDVDGVQWALGLNSFVGPSFPESMIPKDVRSLLESGNYELQFICSEYRSATDEVNKQISAIQDIVKKYSPKGMVIGEAPLMKDLADVTDVDMKNVNMISIVAIFVIIMIVFKSISLPFILVAVIEFAIFVNMAVPYYQDITLPFVAGIVIGAIQLGATVDYAILMTSRYQRERHLGRGKKEAISIAHKTSMKSIIISGCSFFAATFGVGLYSQVDMISSICTLLSRGAVVSTVVVLLVLPAMFMIFDPIICHTSIGFLPKKDKKKIGKSQQ